MVLHLKYKFVNISTKILPLVLPYNLDYDSTPGASPSTSNPVLSSSFKSQSPPAPLLNTHPIQTRSKFGIIQQSLSFSVIISF